MEQALLRQSDQPDVSRSKGEAAKAVMRERVNLFARAMVSREFSMPIIRIA